MNKSAWIGTACGTALGALLFGNLLDNLFSLDGGKAAWFTSRAAGMTAYLLLALSTIWGLFTSSRLLMKWVPIPLASETHKSLAFLAIIAIALHGGALLFDRAVPFRLWEISLPFLSSYRPFAVGLGVLSGYFIVLLTWSFYVRERIGGQRVWRAFHYMGFLTYALATAHGVLAGTDSGSAWSMLLYFVSSAIVLFLTYVRILGGRYIPVRQPHHTATATTAPQHQRDLLLVSDQSRA